MFKPIDHCLVLGSFIFVCAFGLSSCVFDTSPDVSQPALNALTTCDPLYRMKLWLAATSKEPVENCAVGSGEDNSSPTGYSTEVFCWHPTQNSGWIYRNLAVVRPGAHVLNTLNFNMFACEFQTCDVPTPSMTCDCFRCYSTYNRIQH